jgi:Cof subfamily protein (haloacid dehalogenase superfamily)
MRAILLAMATGLLVALVAGLWFFLSEGPSGVLAGGSASQAAQAAAAGRSAGDPSAANDARADEAQRNAATIAAQAAAASGAPSSAASAAASILGRVVGPDATPIAGAEVRASAGGDWSAPVPLDLESEAMPRGSSKIERTQSAADGTFRIEGLERGGLRLAARAHGFAPRYEERWTIKGESEEHLPDLVLAPGVLLSGKIVDRAGQGVPEAQILLALEGSAGTPNVSIPGRGIPLAKSANDGAFVIDELAQGPYHLIIEAEGFQLHEEHGRTQRAGEQLTNLIFVLEPGLEISGRVRGEGALPPVLRVTARPARTGDNPEGQEPEGGAGAAQPSASEARARHALCDAEGNFVLRGLKPAGEYRLTLALPGSEPDTWKRASAVAPALARAGQRGVELVWKPAATLSLRVVDAETRAPIELLEVWAGFGRERALRDDKGTVETKFADGRVRYGELRPQPGKGLWLRLRAGGYKDYVDKSLSIVAGETKDLGEIALTRERRVEVRVLERASSRPVAGARVVASFEPDSARGWLDNDAKQDATGDVNAWAARTDAQGLARLNGAPGKSLALAATAKDFLPSEPVQQLMPSDADGAVEILLDRGGIILVHVTDPSGKPVAGVGIAHRSPSEVRGPEDGDWISINAELKTDAQGLARFATLQPGTHAFCVMDEASQVWLDPNDPNIQHPSWVERNVSEGSTVELAFVAPPRGGISGRIRENAQPLEGAQIRLARVHEGEGGEFESWNGPTDPLSTTSDHAGMYRYEGLRCGEYWLSVHHAARRMSARFRVTIREQPGTYDFDLDVATIEGLVTDIEGRPLPGIEGGGLRRAGRELRRRALPARAARGRPRQPADGLPARHAQLGAHRRARTLRAARPGHRTRAGRARAERRGRAGPVARDHALARRGQDGRRLPPAPGRDDRGQPDRQPAAAGRVVRGARAAPDRRPGRAGAEHLDRDLEHERHAARAAARPLQGAARAHGPPARAAGRGAAARAGGRGQAAGDRAAALRTVLSMRARDFDALVLDLDGTLLDSRGCLRPRNLQALHSAQAQGVRVMIATGRSSLSARAVLAELDLELPAIVFNGAALYCARRDRLLEERILSQRTLTRVLAFARARDLLTVVMRGGDKLSTEPHDDEERTALTWMSGLRFSSRAELEQAEYVIRVTLLSRAWGSPSEFARVVEAHVGQPCYMTEFPLSVLDQHKRSALHVIDLHPPCRGKAEALRYLEEQHAIPPERVVAVGDATNDIPMFAAAGLSVCLEGGMAEARAAARRRIGGHDTDAIAELVEELFLGAAPQRLPA